MNTKKQDRANMKNGFTLIELLAVFILLAVVALITTTIVLNAGQTSKESLYDTQKEMVITIVVNM